MSVEVIDDGLVVAIDLAVVRVDSSLVLPVHPIDLAVVGVDSALLLRSDLAVVRVDASLVLAIHAVNLPVDLALRFLCLPSQPLLCFALGSAHFPLESSSVESAWHSSPVWLSVGPGSAVRREAAAIPMRGQRTKLGRSLRLFRHGHSGNASRLLG